MRAWKLMFLFAKCVLRQQPEVRGGKKKKLKRNESLRTALLERLARWNEGKADVLWAETNQITANGMVKRLLLCSLWGLRLSQKMLSRT